MSPKVLTEIIRHLSSQLPNLKLEPDDYAELRAEIATLGAQLASPRPKDIILQECLKTFKTLLEKSPNKSVSAELLGTLRRVGT